jgi:hypothetical protein
MMGDSLGLGGVAVADGLLGQAMGRLRLVLACLGLAAVAALLVEQNIAGARWLNGSRSVMAPLGGLALGLLAVGRTPRGEPPGGAQRCRQSARVFELGRSSKGVQWW